MVFRADDIGFSKVCNIGSFEAIENGVITAADVMLDSPGTEDALERLKALPWISVGWHMHMWGAPVLDPKQVTSLVEKDGQFAGRFITDLRQSTNVVYDEAVRELRAQLDRCIRILGKTPGTVGGGNDSTPWNKAVKLVTSEYGLVYNFSSSAAPFSEALVEHIKAAKKAGGDWAKFYEINVRPMQYAYEKCVNRKIFSGGGWDSSLAMLTDSISAVEKNYDPVLKFIEHGAEILKYPDDWILWGACHPGYLYSRRECKFLTQ